MRIVRHSQLTTIVDQPGPERLLAGLFGLVGLPITFMPWLIDTPVAPLQAVACAGMGLVAMATGVYIVKTSPRSTVEIDAARDEIRIRRGSVFGVEHCTLSFNEIAAIDLEETKDSDGDPCWRPQLRAKDGRSIPLSRMYRHDRAHQEEVVAAVASSMK